MKFRIMMLQYLTLGLINCTAIAQHVAAIKGSVVNREGKLMEGAIVSILNATDSILFKVTVTDSAGSFVFDESPGDSFYVNVVYTGFKNLLTPIIYAKKNGTVTMDTLVLVPSQTTSLKKVDIVAPHSFVEKKVDRTIVNPDALLTNAGLSVLEVLEKSPGVRVDINSIITLNGKHGVSLFVDDKAIYLQGADLANYLKSIPSSSVAAIEIMTTPPARYDADGNAGIINIKLKKTKARGVNGVLSTGFGQGHYGRSNNSVNLNYRINKINIFTNAGYSINHSYQDLTIKRAYFNTNGYLNSTFTQQTLIRMKLNNIIAKAGFDYFATKKSTIGIVYSGFQTNSKNTITNTAMTTDSGLGLLNRVESYKPSARKLKNGSINVNYTYKPDSTGKELLFSIDYTGYQSSITQSLLSETYLPDNTFMGQNNLISSLPASIDIRTAKADYIYPFDNVKLDVGAKTSFIRTNNVSSFFDENENVLTVNNDFTNSFKYHENINAVYVNTSLERSRYSVQAGLRYENTTVEGLQYGNALKADSSFLSFYNNLFPTLFISYKPDTSGIHQLTFSAGRRIERPNYQDMNPFTYPLDRFTLYAGNPFLKPTFSANFELAHTYNNKVTTTLLYSQVKDVITETIEQNTQVFYSRPGNIGLQTSYGVSLNGSAPFTKWCTFVLYTEVMFNKYKTKLYGQSLDNKGWYWYAGPALQFKISNTWSAECSGSYQTRIVSSQFVLTPLWLVNMAAAKKLFKTRATLKLNVSDIFYTNQPGGEIKNLYRSTAGWHSYLDSRLVTLSFSYRFNKGKSLAERLNNAIEPEKSRVK